MTLAHGVSYTSYSDVGEQSTGWTAVGLSSEVSAMLLIIHLPSDLTIALPEPRKSPVPRVPANAIICM